MVKIKRVYEAPEESDGERILVDRIWPRGLTRESARLSRWARDLAPSTELRKWFGHDPERWTDFRAMYARELDDSAKRALIGELARDARHATVTLLYAARDTEHNNAVLLKESIEKELREDVVQTRA
jgi:uncharacterized protein YeaO (DUF488 family)